jgi:hypothetical protein
VERAHQFADRGVERRAILAGTISVNWRSCPVPGICHVNVDVLPIDLKLVRPCQLGPRCLNIGRALLKSAPAKVSQTDGQYRIVCAAWGAPIAHVEVQIDDGPWLQATIDEGNDAEFAWKLWSLEWPNPSVGEHAITSRATAVDGHA